MSIEVLDLDFRLDLATKYFYEMFVDILLWIEETLETINGLYYVCSQFNSRCNEI